MQFRTHTVTVTKETKNGTDEFGDETFTTSTEDVDSVIVEGTSGESLGSDRPYGTSQTRVFHFPKSYTASLRGAQVTYDGTTYDVVGDPQPWDAETLWNRRVVCEVVDG